MDASKKEAIQNESQKLESQGVGIPPGVYQVDEFGNFAPAVNWQPALERIKWEEVHKLVENWIKRGGSERVINLAGMYILTAIVLFIAGYLSLKGIIEGQAIAGFLGAAIGYLLARSKTN